MNEIIKESSETRETTKSNGYTMEKQLEVGKQAEDIAVRFFKQLWGENSVRDVRDDSSCQAMDVDFYVKGRDGRYVSVEVKGDTYATGNIFLEVLVPQYHKDSSGNGSLVYERAKLGWLFGSKAEYIAYYFFEYHTLFLLDRNAVCSWYIKYISGEYGRNVRPLSQKAAKNRSTSRDNVQYYGAGSLVAMKTLFSFDEIKKSSRAYKLKDDGTFCNVPLDAAA